MIRQVTIRITFQMAKKKKPKMYKIPDEQL
jgi:hypothetical protein